MTTLTVTQGPRRAAATRPAGLMADLGARWTRYRLYRNTYSELAACSDRELGDLGLHRSMIRRLAREAANDARS